MGISPRNNPKKTLSLCYFERKIAKKEHSDAHDVFVDQSSHDERLFGQLGDDERRAARSQKKNEKEFFCQRCDSFCMPSNSTKLI